MPESKENPMRNHSIQIQSRTKVYDGFWQMYKIRLSVPLFRGGMSSIMERELLHHQSAVGILPYDPIRREVVLIEQCRIGVVGSEESAWILEIPAGLIEEGETKETVARRELKEETGLHIKELEFISEYWASPGCSDEKLFLYSAIVDSTQAKEYAGNSSEHEDIKIRIFSIDEVTDLLKSNRIRNATAIIALQWLQLKL